MKVILTICFAVLGFAGGPATAAQSPSAFNHRNATELFGIDHVPKFEIVVSDDQWQWLQAHAVDEEPVQAEARFDGQPAGTIGLRFKGGVGSLTNCVDKATGKLKCPKLSFQLSFEKFDAANRFFGLKRLNLHAMVGDPTKLHERLAYDLFQQSGIKAPRSSWATVSVNGKSYGLFSMVEQVDDLFAADRWPGNGSGNLFKEVWPQADVPPADYAKALATNKETGTPDAMAAFARDMAGAESAGLSAALAKWTDPAYMARYMAVDDAIANCDGITAMYTGDAKGTTSRNHNYFWYQEPNRNFFWLVPWDVNLTFTGCETFAKVPRWNTVPAECQQTYSVWDSAYVHAPGCDRVLQAVNARRADYDAAVAQLLSGPFALQTVLEKIDRWSKFIHDAVIADPTSPGEQAWLAEVETLKAAIPRLRERLKAARDGRSPY